MGVVELQEAWDQYAAELAEAYEPWDANREAAIPLYTEALEAFLTGETDLGAFRTRIDSLGKAEPYWGFRGTSQMFFNQLVKAADLGMLEAALRDVLPAPADRGEAEAKLEAFQEAVEAIRERAEATGATKPGSGRIDSFVSFFWELQDRERWPIFFPNSRDMLERFELLDVNQPQPALYVSYLEAIDELKSALDTGTWGIEHLLWRLGKGGEENDAATPTPPPAVGEAGEGATPGERDLYASYRAQGLHFPDEIVTSLVLSLATKRFVILSGISGTGKTKIGIGLARHLEESGGGESEEFEPPRADATNAYVELTAPKLRRGRVSLNAETRGVIDDGYGLPERGTSTILDAKLPDGSLGTLRLNNLDFSDDSRQLFLLSFRKKAAEWLKASAKPGDFLHLDFSSDPVADLALDIVQGTATEREADITRYELVPVRSDWTDPRGLIGYFNPLTTTYVRTDLIELLLRAADDPGTPYLVILDEMNLARVEYYFSDFLSALESGEPLALFSTGVEEELLARGLEIPARLEIPANVNFIGTVNVDETTHAFSPKVLDRANVIEFSEVDVERALGHPVDEEDGGLRLRGGRMHPGWLCNAGEQAPKARALAHEDDDFTAALEDVHDILARHHRQFGYRVIDEISAFVGHALLNCEGEPEAIASQAFDLQLQQKVIPKLSGGRELEQPLGLLLEYCLNGEKRTSVEVETVKDVAAKRLDSTHPGSAPLYPGSARKLLRMLARLDDTGFVGALE
jgi:hypothetical protein